MPRAFLQLVRVYGRKNPMTGQIVAYSSPDGLTWTQHAKTDWGERIYHAVVYFKVLNPEDAVVKVLDYMRATSLIAQTTLRSVLGQSNLDELLTSRDRVNQQLHRVPATAPPS